MGSVNILTGQVDASARPSILYDNPRIRLWAPHTQPFRQRVPHAPFRCRYAASPITNLTHSRVARRCSSILSDSRSRDRV